MKSKNSCTGGGVFSSLATRRVVGKKSPFLVLALSLLVTLSLCVFSQSAFGAASSNGTTHMEMDVSTAIAMKIISEGDGNSECTSQTGVTYGVVNKYASSLGEGTKQVDTFDGTTGGADEVNNNVSCARLDMTPNTFDSTYSDVSVYTNSPNGYGLTVQAAVPDLTSIQDSTKTIPAGVLSETNGTVPGGQNLWSYKTDNGIMRSWTAMTTAATPVKSYDSETDGGETTRITYGVSTGTNHSGTYVTDLTYTATIFDDTNPYVSKISIPASSNLTISTDELSIPFGHSATVTATPASGYYLSGVSCPTGFTCTGYTTDPADNTSASAQTITVTNGNTNTTGILSLTAAATDPCVQQYGSGYIHLADGHCWTKTSQGTATWANASSKCPSGASLPSAQTFGTLLSYYGGSPYSSNGQYGYLANSSALYDATGWTGSYWSSTTYESYSDRAYGLYVDGSYADVDYGDGGGHYYYKTSSIDVICYR